MIALPTAYSAESKEYTWKKLSYKYIQPNGNYSITPNQMQDLDSYVNGNGVLKRYVLDHCRTKIEWNTSYLTYEDKCKLILAITNGFKYGGLYHGAPMYLPIRLAAIEYWERGDIMLNMTEEHLTKRFPGRVKHIRSEDYRGCKDANEILLKHGKDAVCKAVENYIFTVVS